MRYVMVILALVLLASSIFAADIVTVPTANQLKQGQVDLAYYYIGLDAIAAAPQNVQVQTVYVGLTDQIEVDAHRYDIDKSGDDTIFNATLSVMRETLTTPDLVIGGRNLGGSEVGGVPGSDKKSWFIAAAKTVKKPGDMVIKMPMVVRLHVGLGTKDHTLLGEDRHNGLFGGVQMLLTQQIGLIALQDSQDLITGLTFSPQGTGLTLKGGTYGDHWWVGMSWAK